MTKKEETTEKKGMTLEGVVVKAAMQNTVTVAVNRFVKHSKYRKYFKITKKYKVHDAEGTAQVGDKVVIRETRPISKDKRFVLVK